MKLVDYLLSRGLSQKVIDELLPYISEDSDDSVFCAPADIMEPDRWFYWPGETRFVLVGQCPNGDGVAIDSETEAGAVFYVAHDYLGTGRPVEEMVIRVAHSPSDFVRTFLDDEDFPFDYWEARSGRTEPAAPPNGGPATSLGSSGVGGGPPSVS